MAIQTGITGLEPILAGLGSLAEGLGRSVKLDEQRLESYRRNPQLLAALAPYAQRAIADGTQSELAALLDLPGGEGFIQTLAEGLPASKQETLAETSAGAQLDRDLPGLRADSEVTALGATNQQNMFLTDLFAERNKNNVATLQVSAEKAQMLAQKLGSEMTAENIVGYREYINSLPRGSRERLHAIEALTNPAMLNHRDRLAQMDLQAQLSYLSRVTAQENRMPNSLERYEIWTEFQNRVQGKVAELRALEEERGMKDPEVKELIHSLQTQFDMGQRLINDGYMDAVPLLTVDEYRRWFGGKDLEFTWVAYGDAERQAAQLFADGQMTAEQWQQALGTANAQDPARARRMMEYLAQFKADQMARQRNDEATRSRVEGEQAIVQEDAKRVPLMIGGLAPGVPNR